MRAFWTWCLVLLAMGQAHATCMRVLRTAWSDWPPYSMADAQGKPVGLDVELLQRVAQEAGCSLQFTGDIPAKRQLVLMQSGEQDIQLAASMTPEREAFAWFSPDYRHETVALLVRPESVKQLHIKDLQQLADDDMAVVAPFNGWYGPAYAELLPKLEKLGRLRLFKNTAQGLELLNTRRGDVLVGDRYSFLYVARQLGMPVPQPLPLAVNDDVVHFMFSKKSVPLQDLNTMNEALRRLKRNGELKTIIDRYDVAK